MSSEKTYQGWTEEELQTRLPSEQIPEEHFNNPLHAKLVGLWWTDEKLDIWEDLGEKLEEAFDLLTIEQKLKLASLIESAAIEDPCGEHNVGVWYSPRELVVDEEGVVRGIVGSLHDVKEAAVHTPPITDWVLESIVDSIYEAGRKWKGGDFEVSVGDENDRRWMLRQRQAELIAVHEDQTVIFET